MDGARVVGAEILPSRWVPVGPWGERTEFLAIAPSDPATLYAGASSGLYRSTDSGGLWVAVDIGPADPALGAAGAPITLVAFGDLQSNDYVRLAQEFGRLRDTFGARLRLVYKAVPTFGPASAGSSKHPPSTKT